MRTVLFILALMIGGFFFFANSSEKKVSIDKVELIEPVPESVQVELSTPSEIDAETRQTISQLVSRNHYLQPTFDDVYQQTQFQGSIQDYLKTLDAYSRITSSAEIKFLTTRAKSQRVGVGVDYLFDGASALIFPVYGGELYKSGRQTATLLNSINAQTLDVKNFESYKFLAELQEGETVGLELFSTSNTTVEKIDLKATVYDNIPIRYYLNNNTVVLEVRQFRSGFTGVVREAIREAKSSDVLIMDLRFSPGGDIYAMTDWLSLLLPEGELISVLRTKRYATPTELRTLSGQIAFETPIVVLISRYTASSAEIFARVLSANLGNQVQLVGVATKGKCLAQKSYTVNDQFSLVLSTNEVFMADGNSCHGERLQPDTEFPDIEFKSVDEIIQHLF